MLLINYYKVKKLSKIRKTSKAQKVCKNHWFRRMFTKVLILRELDTQDSNFSLSFDSFLGSFTWPRSFLNTTFRGIIVKAKLMELLMLCHIFLF